MDERVRAFLQKLAKAEVFAEPRTSEWSFGDYDDVFYDGYAQAESDIAAEAREILAAAAQ